jgi:hypothetical protein
MTEEVTRARPAPSARAARDLEPPTVSPSWTLLAGLGILLAVWIGVMPPFAGSDEHDHAYRAAAAARGEWGIDPVNATRGTGAFLDVPSDIVRAARPECQHLIYTKDVDCVGTPASGGKIRIASGAGRYHPLFYAVIGTAALPFDGATALYVMRLATALLAAAFVWMALRATSTWARSHWPYAAIAVACTPVAVYSSAIAAPNGIEMMAALALWTSLVGLLIAPHTHVRKLAVMAAVSGATLATLRPLGPLWCLVVLAAVLVAVPVEAGRIRSLLRRPVVLAGAGLVALSALQATIWVIAVDALKVGGEGTGHSSLAHRLGVSGRQLPAWILQTIAAFPLRDQATHASVYACYLLLFGILITLALRFSHWRTRLAISLLAVAVLLFPYVTTVNSYDRYAAAWQGRYGLPVAMGIVVLSGFGLDRAGRGMRGPTQLMLLLLFAVAQAVSPIHTFLLELHDSPQAHSAAWVHPSLLVVVVVATAGAALMAWGAFGQEFANSRTPRAPG